MNILDFFCIDKPCDPKFQKLKEEYFNELNKTTHSCLECETIEIQDKYLKELYFIMKNL
jgi:hypothetical protein